MATAVRALEDMADRVPPAFPQREGGVIRVQTDIPTTEEEWRRRLKPEQYEVLRKKGTERAFTGKYWNVHDDGVYRCAGCGAELFDAGTKFESGTGWPSFTEPVNRANVELHTDTSYGMTRTEVTCKRCGGHLGHVFDDGPAPTRQRYCINSAALDLLPRTDPDQQS
jgi:peptide-methionine (R)-S-oxide reductase